MESADSSAPTLSGGRYLIERKLGLGGHAAVYRVFDRRLGVRRAVKVMLPEAARRPKLRARFELEARTMATLEHPHVTRVYDVVTDGTVPYIVMELLTGGSLARWLELHGPMPARLAISCVRQAGLGLIAAHERGVIHRDVKPHNILVSAAGVCKVTDFGIARVGELGNTRAGSAMGTEGYMAPEQAKDASTVDVRGDVYGLGMTLFVLVACRDPVERVAGRGLDRLPEALRPVVARATAFDRANRQADVATFLADLDRAVAALPTDPPSPSMALPADEGEDLDPDEMSTLGDGRRTTDASVFAPSAAPRVLPYAVPAHTASERTPDWVEREAGPSADAPYDVELDEAERLATAVAATARRTPGSAESVEPPELPMGARAEEAPGLVRALLDLVIRNLTDPWRVIPVVTVLALGIGVPTVQTRGLRAAAGEVRAARAELEALASDPKTLGAAIAVGGDGETLRTLYADWRATTEEPARTAALERWLDATENDVRLYGIGGMPATDRARTSIAALRHEIGELETTLSAYDAQRQGVSGCFAAPVSAP